MGVLLCMCLVQIAAVTTQIGNVDNQFYITIAESLEISQVQPSQLAEIVLEGVRLSIGVTIVLAQSLSFVGAIPAGKVTVPMLLQTLAGTKLPEEQFTITYLRGNALQSLIEAYMANSVCSFLPDNGIFPQIAGAIFHYNVSACAVTNISVCRRWVLSDPSCQEWTELNPQEKIFLAVEISMYANPVISGIFEGSVAQNVSTNMVAGVLRYFRQYNGTKITKKIDSRYVVDSQVANLSSSKVYILFIVIGLLALINCMICCIRPKTAAKKDAIARKNELGARKDSNILQPHVLNQEMARKDMLDFMRLKNSEVERRMNP